MFKVSLGVILKLQNPNETDSKIEEISKTFECEIKIELKKFFNKKISSFLFQEMKESIWRIYSKIKCDNQSYHIIFPHFDIIQNQDDVNNIIIVWKLNREEICDEMERGKNFRSG